MPHPDFFSSAMLINGNALIEAPKLTANSAVQKDSKSCSSSLSIFSLGQCKILNHLQLVMCHFSYALSSTCYKLLVLISSLKVCRGRKFLLAWFLPPSVLCTSGEELSSVQLGLTRLMLARNHVRKIYLWGCSYAPKQKTEEPASSSEVCVCGMCVVLISRSHSFIPQKFIELFVINPRHCAKH